jgi:hypothetical protein
MTRNSMPAERRSVLKFHIRKQTYPFGSQASLQVALVRSQGTAEAKLRE